MTTNSSLKAKLKQVNNTQQVSGTSDDGDGDGEGILTVAENVSFATAAVTLQAPNGFVVDPTDNSESRRSTAPTSVVTCLLIQHSLEALRHIVFHDLMPLLAKNNDYQEVVNSAFPNLFCMKVDHSVLASIERVIDVLHTKLTAIRPVNAKAKEKKEQFRLVHKSLSDKAVALKELRLVLNSHGKAATSRVSVAAID
jgi:hypothetical protein